jgi:hypothetical protein
MGVAVSLRFPPKLDAAPRCVEDQLCVDGGSGFGNVKRRPFADELQWPGGRQRPGPPPGDEGVRSAAASERVQHRPGWLAIVVWPAAGAPGGLAAVGELQAEAKGVAGGGEVTRPAGQVLLGVAGPDACGQEDLDPVGEG